MNSRLDPKQTEARGRDLELPFDRAVAPGTKREQMLRFSGRELTALAARTSQTAPGRGLVTPVGLPAHRSESLLPIDVANHTSIHSNKRLCDLDVLLDEGDNSWDLKSDVYAQFAAAIQIRLLEVIANSQPPKKLASFIGHITAVEGGTAFVTVLNEETKERFEADCDLSFLRANGINEHTEFLCTLIRNGWRTAVEFSPLPPRVLPEQEIRHIVGEVDSKLG